MNDSFYGASVAASPHPGHLGRVGRPSVITALVGAALVVGSLVLYALASVTQSAPVVDCSYDSCTHTEGWGGQVSPLLMLATGLGAFLIAAAWLVPVLVRHPKGQRVASIILLILALLVTAFFAFVFAALYSTDCSDSDWICFGGPEAAFVFSSPGWLSGFVSLLLTVGLGRGTRRGGQAFRVAGLVLVVGGIVASVVSMVAADVLFDSLY